MKIIDFYNNKEYVNFSCSSEPPIIVWYHVDGDKMIEIGLTGWGDHDTLYEDLDRKSDKLKTYAVIFL